MKKITLTDRHKAYISHAAGDKRFWLVTAITACIIAVRDEYLALVNIYKVLGGGWYEKSTVTK